MANANGFGLSKAEIETLFNTLNVRFEEHLRRHKGIAWRDVLSRLEAAVKKTANVSVGGKIWSLNEMERTGGEPDVVGFNDSTGEVVFFDCATESPKGRRSICYDTEALEARKTFKPGNSAIGMAKEMGIEMLTEDQYRALQQLGHFDTKTSSWIQTPADVRKLGGALFADYRYGKVFVYHNGAESYYAARGFRGALAV